MIVWTLASVSADSTAEGGTLFLPNLWVQAQQPYLSGKLRGLSTEMSVQEAQDHLCQCFVLTSCYIWVKQPSSRLLPPPRNSVELRRIHLPQPVQKPVIPQEQAKGQTGGRDIAKIFPDLKGPCPILFTLLHTRFTVTSKLQ